MEIKGRGTTGISLLYVLVSVSTGNVTIMAEKAYNASVTPVEFEIDEDCELYGTSHKGSNYYIAIHRRNNAENAVIPSNRIVGSLDNNSIPYSKLNISTINNFEYALLLDKMPELNTDEGTFTVKVGTVIISNRTSNRQFTLSEDIVFNKPGGYGSGYCILNTSTLETRVIRSNEYLITNEEETVLAFVRFNYMVIKGLLMSGYLLNGKNVTLIPNIDYKAYTDEQIAKISTDIPAPKMFNPPLNIFKQELRVLDIGNSYTDDATHYLSNLVDASGIDVSNICLYKAIKGGATYKNWYDIFHDQNTSSYSISKCFGGLSCDISGTADIGNGEKFRNTLINNKFDLIIIHQRSNYAPYFEKWEEDTNAGYLSKFIRLIRKYQPQATLGFLLVHSYWSGYTENTEKSSLERWKKIADSAKKLRLNYGIDFIIPYGTAIQNLRASSLNNEYDLTIDGTHCANGLADYTAACTYFQSLIAPRYGISVLGNSARITVEQTGDYPSSNISVTDENAQIAQRAAFLACYNMWECQNPENFEDENLI